jgi:hypothetical protein
MLRRKDDRSGPCVIEPHHHESCAGEDRPVRACERPDAPAVERALAILPPHRTADGYSGDLDDFSNSYRNDIRLVLLMQCPRPRWNEQRSDYEPHYQEALASHECNRLR